jgi:hypothetical protein
MACVKCGNSGWIKDTNIVVCSCCNGDKKMPNGKPCTTCNGTGVVIQKTQYACQYCDSGKTTDL